MSHKSAPVVHQNFAVELAEAAVRIGPVSDPNSLLTGK